MMKPSVKGTRITDSRSKHVRSKTILLDGIRLFVHVPPNSIPYSRFESLE
ncbi:hypothetical protein WN51_11871 [Melipona quadrifasciata]|uniref:Uncharacterized protein n=1 Tax=Melipona quadrifasciata TaxID=166423 RepID=A0A0N0BHS1_9HYME|nr:hypothetical protein WN51_11871 [Melipona quadrifasciata]